MIACLLACFACFVQYPMFARTCAGNSDQGRALASTLFELGFTPYASVVHSVDSYSLTLLAAFTSRLLLNFFLILLYIVYCLISINPLVI
jgi:hypothetical protein